MQQVPWWLGIPGLRASYTEVTRLRGWHSDGIKGHILATKANRGRRLLFGYEQKYTLRMNKYISVIQQEQMDGTDELLSGAAILSPHQARGLMKIMEMS